MKMPLILPAGLTKHFSLKRASKSSTDSAAAPNTTFEMQNPGYYNRKDRKRRRSKLVELAEFLLGKRDRNDSKTTLGSKDSDQQQQIGGFDADDCGSVSSFQARPYSKKLSKLIIFGEREMLPFVPTTDAMVRLDTVIQSDKGRTRLIHKVLGTQGDCAIKIRFCSAVDKFDSVVDEKERKALGEALVELFFGPSSMFNIGDSLSNARRRVILNGNYNQLLDAKREILDELTKIQSFMSFVAEIESKDDL